MKYIIQINTGNLKNKLYETQTIIDKLEEITSKITISKAIIGWYPDKAQNKDIITYLKSKSIETYFWLPVFAEVTNDIDFDENIKLNIFNEHDDTFTKNDKFNFVCESSMNNINKIISKYLEYTESLDFDGVFLDRCRYQSPKVDKNAIFGCMCDNCKKIYKENNINIDLLDEHIYEKLIPVDIKNGNYIFTDQNINNLLNIKNKIITDKIAYLYNYFKSKNKKVGLDTFALSLAHFVGQDLIELSKYSDFIKPMFYLETSAPAGVSYEAEGLNKESIDKINDLYKSNINTISGTISQIRYLKNYNTNITPGIDVCNIENICKATTSYTLEYVKALQDEGVNEIVLSWNALLITTELLDKLKDLD